MSYSARMSPNSDAQMKVSKLVNSMLQVQYDYTAVIADLQKEDPAQVGVRKFVKKMIKTIQSDVQTLIKIQQDWEGSVDFTDLNVPKKVEFESVLEVLNVLLKKEKKINKKLVELHSKLMRNVEQTPTATEEIIEMVQWRDHIIQQIVEHIVHLEQNQGTVGERTVSRMMQEEHSRLKQVDLQEQQVKYQTLLPTTPEQQKLQLCRSTSSKRTILSAKRRLQQQNQARQVRQAPRAEQLRKLKKF